MCSAESGRAQHKFESSIYDRNSRTGIEIIILIIEIINREMGNSFNQKLKFFFGDCRIFNSVSDPDPG